MIIWFSPGIIHWLLIDLELYWNAIKQLSLLIIVILVLKFTMLPFHSFTPTNFVWLFHLRNELVYCFWQHCGCQTENSIHMFVFKAMVGEECVGAIVCKLDMHKKMFRRGYIAMLAVDSKYRRKGIGKNSLFCSFFLNLLAGITVAVIKL